jgi:hypothetical protein
MLSADQSRRFRNAACTFISRGVSRRAIEALKYALVLTKTMFQVSMLATAISENSGGVGLCPDSSLNVKLQGTAQKLSPMAANQGRQI